MDTLYRNEKEINHRLHDTKISLNNTRSINITYTINTQKYTYTTQHAQNIHNAYNILYIIYKHNKLRIYYISSNVYKQIYYFFVVYLSYDSTKKLKKSKKSVKYICKNEEKLI